MREKERTNKETNEAEKGDKSKNARKNEKLNERKKYEQM